MSCRQGPETDAHTQQTVDEQPDAPLGNPVTAQPSQGLIEPEKDANSKVLSSQGPSANEQPDALLENPVDTTPGRASEGLQENQEAHRSFPRTCGPLLLDEDMFSQLESKKTGMDVRLQVWDFPGQEEYALLNQLHFSERAIYLVFFDLTGKVEDEWRHISFWLWKIVRFSTEKDAWPPILLIGTKAGARNRCVTESELRKHLEDLQSRLPRLEEQLQRHPAADLGSKCTKCPWLFPVENKGDNFEASIGPLRMQLQRMALQFVSSRDLWEAENSDRSVVPRFVGLQAETFPLTWLQAHDLLTWLGAGFRREFDVVRRPPQVANIVFAQLLRTGLSIQWGFGVISGHVQKYCPQLWPWSQSRSRESLKKPSLGNLLALKLVLQPWKCGKIFRPRFQY